MPGRRRAADFSGFWCHMEALTREELDINSSTGVVFLCAPGDRSCPVCGEHIFDCAHSERQMVEALGGRIEGKAIIWGYGRSPVETRVVDAKTGGEKGQKLERFDLIPVEPWRALAELFGRGAIKYADDNWRKGYSWRLSIGALQRHLASWLSGHSYDTADGTKGGPITLDDQGKSIHTGSHHLINVVWHCFVLFIFETHKLGTDDRAPTVDV